jgi:hypothetical protein
MIRISLVQVNNKYLKYSDFLYLCDLSIPKSFELKSSIYYFDQKLWNSMSSKSGDYEQRI